MHLCRKRSASCDANIHKMLKKTTVRTFLLVGYGKLETLQTHQEKYDPFKNSQIVLFVYITQGAIHGPCGVAKVGGFTSKYDNVVYKRMNET